MELPSSAELKKKYPLSKQATDFVRSSREAAKNIILRHDPRIVVIAGPCSIHDPEECLNYAKGFKKLADQIQPSCFLIMRAYIEKARTLHGWKGLVYDPDLDERHDLKAGLIKAREFFIALSEMGIPIATEFLSPLVSTYVDDLVTWGFIGARTSSSQIHRELASHFSFPVGFKNSIDGNVETAIHGVLSAYNPHVFFHINDEGKLCKIKSGGNPYAHVVHRGSLKGINYDENSILQTLKSLEACGLPPRILIDCAHGNSQKDYEKQKEAFSCVLDQIEAGNRNILGMMLESHLKAGCQSLEQDHIEEGISITDPCIDWSETEELLLSIHSGTCSSSI